MKKRVRASWTCWWFSCLFLIPHNKTIQLRFAFRIYRTDRTQLIISAHVIHSLYSIHLCIERLISLLCVHHGYLLHTIWNGQKNCFTESNECGHYDCTLTDAQLCCLYPQKRCLKSYSIECHFFWTAETVLTALNIWQSFQWRQNS